MDEILLPIIEPTRDELVADVLRLRRLVLLQADEIERLQDERDGLGHNYDREEALAGVDALLVVLGGEG